MSVSLTVKVREGDFLYRGVHPDGSANWTFFRADKRGRVRPGRFPRRLERIIQKERERNV